jgi:ADP-ribosylation factor-like protein 13B
LTNSVKTTFTLALSGDPDPFVVPTVGFSAPIKKHLFGTDVVFYDLGGGVRIRGIWPSYFADVHGVVYVVDAADRTRMAESAAELRSSLTHPMVVGKPLLV